MRRVIPRGSRRGTGLQLRAAAAAAGMGLLMAGCWPAPGGNANRDGHNGLETEISVTSAPSMAESWQAPGSAGFSPTIVGQRVYVAGDQLRAIDIETGAVLWQRPESPSLGGLGLFYADGELLVRSQPARSTYATTRHDRATGASLGHADLPSGLLATMRGTTSVLQTFADPTSPVHVDSVVVADGENAARNWNTVVLEGDLGSRQPAPTSSGDRVIVSGRGMLSTDPGEPTIGVGVRAYDLDGAPDPCATVGDSYPATYGCPAWATAVPGTALTSPVLSNDATTVFVGSDAGALYALDEATGEVLWSAATSSSVTADPAVVGGVVIVPTASSGLVALAADGCGAATCGPLWTAAAAGAVEQQPVAAGGAVFAGSDDGVLRSFAVDGCGASTCDPVWATDLGGSFDAPMALASGHLIVTVDGVLHAFAPTA